jgi:hypothetical protein
MTRLMRDSTNLKDIPIHGTDLVAGYVVNGNFIASEEDFARFRGIPHVHIDAMGLTPMRRVFSILRKVTRGLRQSVPSGLRGGTNYTRDIRLSSTVIAVTLRRCSTR